MSEHANVEFACALIKGWNARDLGREFALLSEDCVVEICDEAPAQGPHAACKTIQRWLAAIPDLWFDVMEVAATEQAAVVRWRAVGTLWNDLSVAGTARRPVEVDGFTVVGIKQGKIIRLWHYWDADELVQHVTEQGSAA